MMPKILLVDDEERILSSYRRTLRKNYQIFTALGGVLGLDLVRKKGPFSVVISDMKMQEMNGIQFLQKVEKESPDSVRIMLTGNADFKTAYDAVNEGHIFRFLTKPCSPDLLNLAIAEGVKLYNLQKAEQDLLAKTLRGSIQVMMEILSTFDPVSFNKVITIRDLVRKVSGPLKLKNVWEIEIGILLSGIGRVAIPAAVMSKVTKHEPLSDVELKMISQVPESGFNLLQKIPRLKGVSEIVRYQNYAFKAVSDADRMPEFKIPLGARLLHIFSDMIDLERTGLLRSQALATMAEKTDEYDPELLKKIRYALSAQLSKADNGETEAIEVRVSELKAGMILRSKMITTTDLTLLLPGQRISETLILRIKNWTKLYEIKEPLSVLKPDK